MIKNALLILLGCFAVFHINAQSIVSSQIQEVTVFSQGAQLTRKAHVALHADEQNIVLSDLSPYIDVQSIQVSSKDDVLVKAVHFSLNYLANSQDIDGLESEKQLVETKILQQQARQEVLAEEIMVLQANRTLGEGQSLADLDKLSQFFRDHLTDIKQQQLHIRTTLDSLNQLHKQLETQLSSVRSSENAPVGEINITLFSRVPQQISLEIRYKTEEAGWFPSYDARVEDIEKPLTLTYKANVYQRTGEDWNNVSLTLSNANPNQSNQTPAIDTWYLDFLRNAGARIQMNGVGPLTEVQGRVLDINGDALPGVNVLVAETTVGTITNLEGYYRLALPINAAHLHFSFIGYRDQTVPIQGNNIDVTLFSDIAQLNEVVVTGYEGKVAGIQTMRKRPPAPPPVPVITTVKPTTVHFDIAIPYTIPGDGKQYTVEISRVALPVHYQYKAVPKLQEAAFLTAQITGWEQHHLLAGEVNLFLEGTFVGRTVLNTDQISDTLALSLGQDPGITVTREKVEEYTKRNFIGTTVVDQQGYIITIRNHKAKPVNLIIQDQLPVSANSQIRVETVSTDGGHLQDDTGTLSWEFTLSPSSIKTIEARFNVRYPSKEKVLLD